MEASRISRRALLMGVTAAGIAAARDDFAQTQPAQSADLLGGKIVFENEKARVIEHFARPRLGVRGAGMHTHPPHLTVFLTDAMLRAVRPGREPVIVEKKAGDVVWDPGGTHAVENIGSRDTEVYLVEPKGA